MEPITVLIVDDHTVIRDGLTPMMERQHDFTVVGEAKDGLEAVERAGELRPDVILMDLRMPVLDGMEAMHRIRAEDPDVKFIVVTTYDSDEYIFDAIAAGAKGYLLKDASREEAIPGGAGGPPGRVSDRAVGGRQSPGPFRPAFPPDPVDYRPLRKRD